MRYSFRLAELLHYSPDPKKRPGVIKAICNYTGLDRHQVAALLRNEVKNIPLDALSRLCDYLVEHGHAAADQLPAALFAVEAENFWELLARRNRLELCVGVRRTDQPDWPEGAWVVASDSLLLGELLNGVSTLGGTAKLQRGQPGMESRLPHPEHLKQSLVWAPGQAFTNDLVLERAREIYDEFSKVDTDKALICLGSTKSNPVVELVMSAAFGCDAYQSQDGVKMPGHRSCPFFVRYRDRDPHTDSCCGGVQLSSWEPTPDPGIYYEQADGKWGVCRCDDPTLDAAFVFYIHRESQGWLEMALGGFSGRATRMLAKTLASRAEDFWPPVYNGFGIQAGAFLVQYKFSADAGKHADLLGTDISADAKVIPLAREVIERRLEPSATASVGAK